MEKYVYIKNASVLKYTVTNTLSGETFIFDNETIPIFQDDNIVSLKEKIETLCKIPFIEQLVYTDDNIPLGFSQSPVIKVKFPLDDVAKIRIDKIKITTYDIIPEGITSFNVISLGDYIVSIVEQVYVVSEFDIKSLYGNIIKKYWPSVTLSYFTSLVRGETYRPKIHNFTVETNYIKNVSIGIKKGEINKYVTIDVPNRISMSTKTYYGERLNLDFIFDQLELSKKYHNMYYKKDGSLILRKYYNGNKINYEYPRKEESIKINNDIYIYPERIEHKDDKIIKLIKDLTGIDPLHKYKNSKYHFLGKFKKGIFSVRDFMEMVKGTPKSIMEYDYRNIDNMNYSSIYYKRVNVDIEDVGDIYQYGTLIRIRGQNIISITIANVKQIEDLQRSYNFIARILTLYYKNYLMFGSVKDSKRNVFIKSNLKNIDPVLYGYHKRDVKDYNLYTRKIAKNKHPIIFPEGSNVLKKYMKEYGITKMLKYKNFTYKNTYSNYICPEQKYPNFHFISPDDHPDNICMLSCGVGDQSDKILHKKCLEGKPFSTTDINENIGATPSNMYYISRFNPEKTLLERKLQKLPSILHKYLNGDKCARIGTILDKGMRCYLLIGSADDRSFKKTVEYALPNIEKYKIKVSIWEEQWNILNHYYKRKINIVIYEYMIDSGDINIYNLIDRSALSKILKEYKSIFILRMFSKEHKYYRYSIITSVSLLKKKKYSIFPIFDPSSDIVKRTNELVERIIRDDMIKNSDFISLYDLVRYDIPFTQIKTKGNLIYEVIVKKTGVIFPIIPSLLNITIKHLDSTDDIIKKHVKKNTQKNVLETIKYLNSVITDKKIEIKAIVSLGKYGNYAGFKFHNDYIVMYTETKQRGLDDLYGIYDDIIHIDTKDSKMRNVVNIWRNIEVYNLLMIHIAYHLNRIIVGKVYDSIDKWEKKLLEVYGDKDSKLFKRDYHMMVQGKYNEMEFYKKHKLKIMFEAKTKDDILRILKDLMKDNVKLTSDTVQKLTSNKYRKLCGNKNYTITGQCSGNRLKVDEKKYELFMDLISREIFYNDIRRYEILENKVSYISKLRGHTYIKDNIIEEINIFK